MNVGETVFWTLMAVLTPLMVGAFAVVAWWMVRQRGSNADTDRIDKIWQQREIWGEEACRQLIQGRIAAGMTPDMVELAWGKPRQQRPTAVGQQWLYDNLPAPQSNHYVMFENGRITATVGEAPKSQSRVGPWLVISMSLGISLLVTIIALLVVYLVR